MTGNMRHTGTPDPQEQELDADIHTIRAEIKALQHRKRILTTTLLSSKPLQPLLSQKTSTTSTSTTTLSTLKEDLSPLASAADAHNTANNHRIAFGATAFPFKDPSPNTAFPNLLGIRIDVCARDGRFVKPYYVLLRRERGGNGRGNGKDGRASVRLCVHRHTVPAFIAIKRLESVYLAGSGSGSAQRVRESDDEDESESEDVPMKGGKGRKQRQDLRGFVRELRREVVAWHLRCDAVTFLREKLGLVRSDTESDADVDVDVDEEGRSLSSPKNELGIIELEATAIEARYVRMEWEDGRLGQFKLTNSGTVERAIFMNDRGRDKVFEDAVIGGGGRIESLVDRLTRLSNESE